MYFRYLDNKTSILKDIKLFSDKRNTQKSLIITGPKGLYIKNYMNSTKRIKDKILVEILI